MKNYCKILFCFLFSVLALNISIFPDDLADDFEKINEADILRTIEMEIGGRLGLSENNSEKEPDAKNIENSNGNRQKHVLKVTMCSKEKITGISYLMQEYFELIFEKNKISSESILFSLNSIRKIEFSDWKKVHFISDRINYYFPEKCNVTVLSGSIVSGQCRIMNWLKLTIYTPLFIKNIYSYYTEPFEGDTAEKKSIKKNKNNPVAKKEHICSIEFINEKLKDPEKMNNSGE